jgi:hypothetical protein
MKQKWRYWMRITWIDPDLAGDWKVGDVFGAETDEKEWWVTDDRIKGFSRKARMVFLGKTPFDLHKTDPAKCTALLKEWKAKKAAAPIG